MKLKSDRVLAIRKGLVFADAGRGKPQGASGQIERVAVPVKHASAENARQTGSLALPREIDWKEADLLLGGRIDPSPKASSHQLSAQTDTDRCASSLKPLLDIGCFRLQKRVDPIVTG